MRETWLSKSFVAGCFQCHGGDGAWFGKNAQAVAARHHDATGHTTFVRVTLYYTYGDKNVDWGGKNT